MTLFSEQIAIAILYLLQVVSWLLLTNYHKLLAGPFPIIITYWWAIKGVFGIAFQPVFWKILNFVFTKIKCGLYFLDRCDVLILKMIFKK